MSTAATVRLRLRLLLPTLLALGLSACGDGGAPSKSGGPGGPGGGMPPAAVGVVEVRPEPVALDTELPGRVEALRSAQVRARVNGVVQQRLFREGSDIKQGQPLFRIDPAPYQAALDSAQATLLKADSIVVLEGGRIVDIGRHDELVARGGLYAKLAAMQFGQTDDGD